MATLDDLKGLGYEVGLSFEGEDFAVHRVEGFGLSTQVRDDDGETIQSIADSHEEAVQQQDETMAETQLRWAGDPDNPYELDDEAKAALEEQVQQEKQA